MTEKIDVNVVLVDEVDKTFCEDIKRLIRLMSTTAELPTEDDLRVVAGSPSTSLMVAREKTRGRIIGTLTLVTFRIPTGVRAWIEDVVVDPALRGRGIGEQLTREAIRLAVEGGARTVELTSRPSRETANRLYRRIGFQERETNVYRFTPAE